MIRLYKLLMLAVCLGGVSCRQYEGSDTTEKEHPKIKEARLLVQQQNLTDAEQLLHEVLRSNPNLALAHMQLGMIYQSMEKPVDAIYHFERYVAARPDSQKAEILKQVMEDERRRLAANVYVKDLPEDAPLKQVETLRMRLAEAEQLLAERELELQQAALDGGAVEQTPPPEWAAERLQLLRTIQQLQMQGTASGGNVETSSPTASSETAKQTYKVQRGDTLSSIAQNVYGRASDWRKIYEANKELIPNKNVVSPGTVLILP